MVPNPTYGSWERAAITRGRDENLICVTTDTHDITGGLLQVMAFGAGAWSIDGRMAHAGGR